MLCNSQKESFFFRHVPLKQIKETYLLHDQDAYVHNKERANKPPIQIIPIFA